MGGNEGSESLTDAEAVNKIMETIHKVTKEFREAETKVKLKDCQGIQVRSYQHQGNYIARDKVWYQYKDGNSWHGPAEVIYQKGNAIFIHSNGDVKKVAACKVKPYDLKERTEEENKANNDKKKESETEIEEIEDENEVRRDLQNDIIGAKHLQVEKSVYFMNYEIFSLEVPVKEHGKPEIVNANNEKEN